MPVGPWLARLVEATGTRGLSVKQGKSSKEEVLERCDCLAHNNTKREMEQTQKIKKRNSATKTVAEDLVAAALRSRLTIL